MNWPPPEQTVPGYWPFEATGVLAPVVQAYLRGETLEAPGLAIMRAYLAQWMAGDFRGPQVEELQERIAGIRDMEALHAWLADALNAGIDPL